MGVTFIAPAEQFTSPAKLITKEITEDGTYYAADDNANGYSSVEVSVGGGGGGIDVNHLALTIVNNTANSMYFSSDLLDSINNLMLLIDGILFLKGDMFDDPVIISGGSATVNLPYYSSASNYLALVKGNHTMVASGAVNCEYNDDEYYPEIDVGECTESSSIIITIS